LENVIIKFVADTSGLEPAIKQLELLGKISKDDAAAFAQVNNEQKEFIQNLNKSTTEMGKLSNEVDGLMAEIQAGVMEGFADHLAEVTKETKQAGGGFKSMKQELKELKAQIASGSLGEKELREATKRAAELTDTIGDVNDKVKALASDTKRIDAVVTAFRGIAAAASVAAGAAALFGGENEKLTKTLAQAQGAMALLQGVQELANIATTEGALRTFLLDGAQKAATISSAIMGRTIAASTAVATGGISLLLAGLAYLIITMDDARDTANTMNKALEGDAEARKKAIDIRFAMMKDGQIKERLLLKNEYQKQLNDLYEQVRTEKVSRAASQSLSLALTQEYFKDLQDLSDKYKKIEADAAKALADKKKAEQDKLDKIAEEARKKAEADAAARAKLLFELSEQLKQNMLKQEIIQTEYFKSVDEIDAMYAELAQDRRFTTSEQIYAEIEKRLQAEYEASVKRAQIDMAANEQIKQNYYAQTDIQIQFKKTQAEVDAEYEKIAQEGRLTTSAQIYAEIAKRYQAEVNAAEKTAAEDKQRREQAIKEYTKLALSSAQTISDTIFTINQQNRDAETASILESLSMRKDAELANKELTDAQRLQIEERYAQQEAEIKTRAWEAQKQAATMQAIINGALTIGNILATMPGGPLNPATIASLAAAAIATGAQIAIIESAQPPKFADGGMVGGQLHSSGGTLIEAERGEYVINRQSTSDYLPSLKVLNSGEVEPTFANNILTALANGTFDLAAQFQTKQSASSDGINYDKLDRIMAKHKSNLNVNIDEQGLTTFLLKENSRVEFRNKKMRYRA
jgi:hypothetical protein